MKKIIISIYLFVLSNSGNAQQILIDELKKQERLIDSLERVIKNHDDKFDNQLNSLQNNIKNQRDTIKNLKQDISTLIKNKDDIKKLDSLLIQKSDSIILLSEKIERQSKQLEATAKKHDQDLQEEKSQLKNAVNTEIINSYKDKDFDAAIQSVSKNLLQRDLTHLENINDMKFVKSLIIYFEGKSILYNKYDPEQVKSNQIKLNQIKQESPLLNMLKNNIANYSLSNDGLIICLNNIKKLDEKEVKGMEKATQEKLNKIMTEVSRYIFDYDLNADDYPYLMDILFQVIKLKKPNPDADISNLIKKLQ